MPYSINKTNGDLLVTVEDGTADLTTTSLALVGRNYAGYGEFLNENFIKLLENFSRSSQPPNPITGQLWYDSTNKLLKVFDGTGFVSSGGGIELDETSTAVHYHTFVETEFGLPPTKVAKERGLSYQPISGYFSINKATAGSSRLEINNSSNSSRSLNPTLVDTIIHVHGEDQGAARMLFDTYSGSLATSPSITFRRGPTFGQTGTQAATQLNSVLGSIGARGHTGASYTPTDRAKINFVCSQTWTASSNGTKIEFYATQDGTQVTELKAIIHGNGDFEAKGDIIGFSLSDERLKTNVVRIENALSKIDQLEGVLYNWNQLAQDLGKKADKRESGLLAGQVNRVLPEVVQHRDNGMLAIKYEGLFGLVIEAIKELKAEVVSIKNAKAV